MADKNKLKQVRLERRRLSARNNGLFGSVERPRLSVFRSDKHIYAQIIDDATGKTLLAINSGQKEPGLKHGGNKTAATVIGKLVATKAIAAGITEVAFDRAGYRYHGRVKALADAAREGGLKF